jgi:hypothetical protein
VPISIFCTVKTDSLIDSLLVSAACPAHSAVQLSFISHCRVTACQLFCHLRQNLRPSPHPDRIRSRGPAAPLHDLHIISIITREFLQVKQIVISYLVASKDLCISKPLLIRRPNHSSSLQCTLSSSLKWSSKSPPAASAASSSLTLSSAAFTSRRTLAESR